VKRNTIQSIDEFYGDGYAMEHPEVLVASLNLMQDLSTSEPKMTAFAAKLAALKAREVAGS
jgi:hypothetical protein